MRRNTATGRPQPRAALEDPRNAAKRLGLSVSTLYRHAPGLRSRVGEKA